MTELSDCCGVEVEQVFDGFMGELELYKCSTCGKPCKVVTPQEKVDRVDSDRLLTNEQIIDFAYPRLLRKVDGIHRQIAEQAFAAGEVAQEKEIVRLLYRAIESVKQDYEIELSDSLFEVFNAIRNQAILAQKEKGLAVIKELADAALAEAEKKGARKTYEEIIQLMKDNSNLENNERVIRIWLHLQSKLKELEGK